MAAITETAQYGNNRGKRNGNSSLGTRGISAASALVDAIIEIA
jgi:hypothetical protein